MNEAKSDTPRTDEQIAYTLSGSAVVPAQIARQLERELTAARAEVEQLKTQLADCADKYGKDTSSLARERNAALERAEQAERGLDVCRNALAYAIDHQGHHKAEFQSAIDAAIAGKEGK